MADENEYVYRLGLDSKEFVDGIQQALSALGSFDDTVVSKMPAKLRRLSKDMADVGQAAAAAAGKKIDLTVDDRKALAAEKRQQAQLKKLQDELKQAADAYARFQRESARGSGVPGGKDLSKASDAQLARYQQVQKALQANGVSTPGNFGQAVAAEISGRKAAVKAQADGEQQKQAAAARTTQQELRDTRDRIIAEQKAAREAESARAKETRAAEKAAAQEQKLIADRMRSEKTAAERMVRNYEAALPRVRYVLYDIANTAATAGAATLGAGIAILKVGADYEAAYANVKRTSDILTDPSLNQAQRNDRYAQLRKELVGLSEELPKTFQDLTEIAKVGNQLGISSTNIVAFTRSVAQFSAVTGVSTDAAATAFGRLGEILNDQNYKRIGDQIAYLGVRSVATEDQIINTATQLAVSGQGIRLTTKDVLALSTTVAGLGVKPEQARGTFIRAFSQIGSAVNAGGASLNSIAKISGTTADQFKADFNAGGDSAYGAFLRFTAGLGDSSAEINANLDSIGITAVRDRQTLGLLAQNGGRALKDLENASDGAKNGFLGTAYEEQAKTVNARLVTLGNTVKAIFDEIGQSTTGPISAGLKLLQGFLQLVQSIVAQPFTAWAAGIITILAVLGGAALIAGAGFARFAGFLVALNQIQQLNINGQKGMAAVMAIVNGTANRERASIVALSTAQTGLITPTRLLTAEQRKLAISQGLLSRSGKGLSSTIPATRGRFEKFTNTLGKVGVLGGILALIASTPLFISSIASWADQITGASRSAEDLEKKLQNLSGASKAQNLKAIKDALPGGPTTGDAITSGFLDPFANGDQNIGNGRTGFNYTRNGRSANITGAQGAFNQITTGQRTPGGSISFFQGSAQFDKEVDTQLAKIDSIDKALTALYQAGDTQAYQKGLQLYTDAMERQGVSAGKSKDALIGLKAALKEAGVQADDSADDIEVFTEQLNGIFDANIFTQKVTGELGDLGEETKKVGATVAFQGEKMKTALADIYASTDDPGIAKGRLISLYTQLKALGYEEPALRSLALAIASISGAAKDSPINIDAFTQALSDSGDAAEEQLKTLSDYADELGGVLSRAFDLRFGSQLGMDAVTKSFLEARDAVKDTASALKDARAELAELNGDLTAKKYYLSIAEAYGDTEQAAKLRGDIAGIQSDIRGKKGDIAERKTANSRALTGNSEAALNNRATLTGQIQTGQAYLQTLAGNGATQKQLAAAAERLKKQFVDQAVQLGYNRKDVEKLALAYDDYKKLVAEVPRKVDIELNSNVGPAQNALNEYLATLKAADGTETTQTVKLAFEDAATGQPVSTTTQYADDVGRSAVATTPGTAGETPQAAAARKAATAAATARAAEQKAAAERYAGRQTLESYATKYPRQWSAFLSASDTSAHAKPTTNEIVPWALFLKRNGFKVPKGFREGGYTGDAAPWQMAGIVHGREYVLNERAQQMFPRQMLDAANAGVAPVIPKITTTATLGGDRTMSLGRVERQLLAAAGGSGTLTVRGDRFGSAMDDAFRRSNRRGGA